MRSVKCLVWSGLFVLGAAVPAFCQVIVPPNIPGAALPADLATAAYQQNVFSTGPFDFLLGVFKNGRLKFTACATVCTSGPYTAVSVDVPFGSLGLKAGDVLTFAFAVTHRGTEGNTTSLTISIIPIVGASSPPIQTTAAPRSGPLEPSRWGRREETRLG